MPFPHAAGSVLRSGYTSRYLVLAPDMFVHLSGYRVHGLAGNSSLTAIRQSKGIQVVDLLGQATRNNESKAGAIAMGSAAMIPANDLCT